VVLREFFIDNLLVRIHCIIERIRWAGLASWEFEFPFPGGLTSTFLTGKRNYRWFLYFTFLSFLYALVLLLGYSSQFKNNYLSEM